MTQYLKLGSVGNMQNIFNCVHLKQRMFSASVFFLLNDLSLLNIKHSNWMFTLFNKSASLKMRLAKVYAKILMQDCTLIVLQWQVSFQLLLIYILTILIYTKTIDNLKFSTKLGKFIFYY